MSKNSSKTLKAKGSAEDKKKLAAALRDGVRISKARKSFADFARYCGMDEKGIYWERLSKSQEKWARMVEKKPRCNIVSTKKWGKSALITVLLPIYTLGHDPEALVKIVGYSQDESAKRTREILKNIRDNKRVRKVFPKLKLANRDPSEIRFTVKRKSLSGEESVRACSVFGATDTSGAGNLIIFDDCVCQKSSLLTPADRAKIKSSFYETWTNICLPAGKIINLSNSWSTEDLTSDLKVNVSYVTSEVAGVDDKGKSTWPEKFPQSVVDERKAELPDRVWRSMWKLEPMSPEESVFNIEAVKGIVKTIPFIAHGDGIQYFAGIDLAISKAKTAAFFALSVGARTPDGRKHLVEVFRKRGLSFPQQVAVIEEKFLKYKFSKVSIEDISYQKVMVDEFENTVVPVQGYTTTARSKDVDMVRLAGEIENNVWSFWAGRTKEVKAMVEEIATWPIGLYTDCLMSLIFLNSVMGSDAHLKSFPKGSAPGFHRRFEYRKGPGDMNKIPEDDFLMKQYRAEHKGQSLWFKRPF